MESIGVAPTQGEEPAFARAEYEERLRRTRVSMAGIGLDVLLVTDPANINYLTGYDAWSFYVHQMLVVQMEGSPLWIGRASDRFGVGHTTYLPPDNVLGYAEESIESVDNHAMKFVASVVKDLGHGAGRVGVEMEAYYYTARCHAMLNVGLPEALLTDATGLVNRVRLIKSEPEIAFIREAARIADHAMQVAIDNIAPDVRQNDAVAAILQAQITGFPEYGGDYTAIVPMLPSGVLTSAPHMTWSDRRFRKGEGTIIELSGCRRRYHCPLARTVFLGTPPDALLDTAKAVVEGVEATLAAVRPGIPAEEVEAVWRNTVARWGVIKESRLGYSIGINYPPDWGEHSISLRPGDASPLEANMTFHLMPGLWYEEWGIEISQPFRVTETGAEPLTTFPRELIIKP